ncbi:MAG: hypothetical protein OXR64_00235 [Chloroflexota bacterium]|nr:hypothetical protein [Chloroflexota bacterium]MDE2918255.1 hypothetical protein [Chloroflexota bacterium]
MALRFPRYLLSGVAFPGHSSADLVAEARALELDAVDLVVAPGGQVDPSEAIDLIEVTVDCEDAGVQVVMVTTELTSPFDDHAEDVHRGCEEARVPYIRYGAWTRLDGVPYLDSLQAARAGLRGLETLCRRHNLRALVRQLPGSFQEQSGHAAALLHGRLSGYVGMCLAPGEFGPVATEAWQLDLDALDEHVQALSITNSAVESGPDGWSRAPAVLTDGFTDWPQVLAEVSRRELDLFAILEGGYIGGSSWGRDSNPPADPRQLFRNDLHLVRQQLGTRPVRRKSNKPRRWYRPL